MKTKEDILELIEEEDVEFIRLQFTDIWGNLKNIAITPVQLMRVKDNKFYFENSAVYDSLYSFPEDLYLVPDFDTFVILPWRPQQGKVGKLICDICNEDGTLFALSPRTILKNVIKRAEAKGFSFDINPECEFFLFHTDENGNPTTVSHENAGYLDVGPADFGENARRDMVLALEEMGFEIESSHHEKAPAQHEIDFSSQDALKTADAIMTFRFAVRSIAKRFGLYATFMPKPVSTMAGSGLHLKFSVYKDGKNIFRNEDSIAAKSFIAGILAHSEGIFSVTNPVVNSYKRIISTFNAPAPITWSTRGENTMIKFHDKAQNPQVELRFPDSASNPYLALATCIEAGIKGIEEGLDPDKYTGRNKKILPDNLDDAITLLNKDEFLVNTLGKEFTEVYSGEKKKEWREYITQVSSWEVNRYLSKM